MDALDTGLFDFLFAAVIVIPVAFYLLWFFYLALMTLSRVKDAGLLTMPARILGFPIFLLGYAIDIFLNLTVFSILLLHWPRHFTISGHIEWLLVNGNGYQRSVSCWICHHFLDSFDHHGEHCHARDPKV